MQIIFKNRADLLTFSFQDGASIYYFIFATVKIFQQHPTKCSETVSYYHQNRFLIKNTKLIQECLAGNRAAQNELYQLFAPAMFTVCLRYGKDRDEAAEMLQKGFIKLFACLHQYRGEGSFEGWIRTVVVTTSLQHLRKRSGLHAMVSIENSGLSEMQEKENIESDLSVKELLDLVQSLPLAYRLVFNLHVFEGYKHKEIGEILGISENTSKSNLFDARQWLKDKITKASLLKYPKKQYL